MASSTLPTLLPGRRDRHRQDEGGKAITESTQRMMMVDQPR
jgi:hypothetical protein